MKTIAIIPARAGSKRLERKNTRYLAGIPLIKHSILFARKNKDIVDEIIVTTNDAEVKQIAGDEEVRVVDRPENLCDDNAPTVWALDHVLSSLDFHVENVIVLQPTNPLRPANLLYDAWKEYQKGDYDSLITLTRMTKKFGKIVGGRFMPANYQIGQRSQDLEPLFFENGLLYICKSRLIKNGVLVGEKNLPFLVDHLFGHVDIDTIEDFKLAESMLNCSKGSILG